MRNLVDEVRNCCIDDLNGTVMTRSFSMTGQIELLEPPLMFALPINGSPHLFCAPGPNVSFTQEWGCRYRGYEFT
jgi:hypothetical protein